MKTFTVRTTVGFAGVVTAILVVVLAIGGWLLNRQMIAGLELLHEVEAAELAELLGPDATLDEAEIRERIEHDAELFFIQVQNRGRQTRFRSENLAGAALPNLQARGAHATISLNDVGPVLVSEFGEGGWRILLGSRLEPVRRVLRDYAQVAGLLVLGGAVASMILGWGFSRFTLRPISSIERTARKIGGHNLGERIPVPPGDDELASLSRLLNETFDRIEAAFGQVKQFTADASHELKTPLALIRLNAEKLRPRLGGDTDAEALLEDLLIEVERQHQIIESLLFLSKAESGVLTVERHPLKLLDWVHAFAEDAAVLAEDAGVQFRIESTDTGTLRGMSGLLRQLLVNLVSNALKASAAGSLVTLQSCRFPGGWRWVVEDAGPGLPEEQLKRVFDRFTRYEATGRARGPGHGLGLAICKSIVDLHGGTIHAENRRDRTGLRLIVELPDGPERVG